MFQPRLEPNISRIEAYSQRFFNCSDIGNILGARGSMHYATNRRVADSAPDEVIFIFT
jgi:hypothetical protein